MHLDGETEPIYSPVCVYCRHVHNFGADRICDAFPNGLPLPIGRGKNDHSKPYRGDLGMRFEALANSIPSAR